MSTLQRPLALAQFLVILTLFFHGRAVAAERAPQNRIQPTMHQFFQAPEQGCR